MSPLIRPLASGLAQREDGTFGMVDTLGQPMPDDAKIVVTAGELAKHLVDHTVAGIRIGAKRTAEADAQSVAAALPATITAAAQAGAQTAAQPAFDAGTRYAATAIAKTTVVRRRIERDSTGQITGTVESREPIPSMKGQP